MSEKLEKRAMLHHNLAIIQILLAIFVIFLVIFLGLDIIGVLDDIKELITKAIWGG